LYGLSLDSREVLPLNWVASKKHPLATGDDVIWSNAGAAFSSFE
jgi:hypothetical protein